MNKQQAQERINFLLAHPDKLLLKRPFTRGSNTYASGNSDEGDDTGVAEVRTAQLPDFRRTIVTQDKFLKELDPMSHEVMFDANLPSICVKLQGGGYSEIAYKRMPLAFQERIRQKKTLTMCGNPCEISLRNTNPSETDKKNTALIRSKWRDRNQDGMRTKSVYTQLGLGDVGLLFYFDREGRIKSRLLSYEDGYVIVSHNDDNGDRLMECVYYKDCEGVEYIDCYDDTYLHRISNRGGKYDVEFSERHGFKEIPLCTKRGAVAWNDVQGLIEAYETLYNVFIVIQKRHGWGILYIKGKFKESVKKLAGSIILNDTSTEGNGSAEFKAPPTPTGYLDTLQSIYEQIQIHSSTTFILPKDVKSSGDVSALAIMLTQELDIEGATQGIIDWQNFADKQLRLFKYGLACELVNSGENPNAITEFAGLNMNCKFKIWRPFNEYEFNQMVCTLKGAGLISKKTGVEINTLAQPDEEVRIAREEAEAAKAKAEKEKRKQELAAQQATAQNGEQESDNNNPTDE